MKIERATIDDDIILTGITKKSKAYWGYSDEQIEKWNQFLTISKEYIVSKNVFKLTNEKETVGYYSYYNIDENTIKLDNLFLLPDYIGKGLGKLLINNLLIQIKLDNSINKVTLHSEPNAEIFYQKLGFSKVGEFETSIKNRYMPIMEMAL